MITLDVFSLLILTLLHFSRVGKPILDRNDDVREPNNEPAIEVGEPQKGLDCLEVSRGWPDADCVSFGHVHQDASGGDHKAQELNLLCVEKALLGFRVQVVLAKALQDTLDVNPTLFQRV